MRSVFLWGFAIRCKAHISARVLFWTFVVYFWIFNFGLSSDYRDCVIIRWSNFTENSKLNQNVTAGADQTFSRAQPKIMKSQIKISLQCLDRKINKVTKRKIFASTPKKKSSNFKKFFSKMLNCGNFFQNYRKVISGRVGNKIKVQLRRVKYNFLLINIASD